VHDALIVFVAQFVQVLLLGLQSLNVNHGRRAAAATVSLLLGTIGFHITATIASHRGEEFGTVWWCYVFAGPCGILTSMLLFSRTKK
jgi:hypothetical protein